MNRSGRNIAWSVVTLGIVTLGAAGIMLRTTIIENYYLWKLSLGNESEKRSAAENLGDMRSLKAIPKLCEMLDGEPNIIIPVDGNYHLNP